MELGAHVHISALVSFVCPHLVLCQFHRGALDGPITLVFTLKYKLLTLKIRMYRNLSMVPMHLSCAYGSHCINAYPESSFVPTVSHCFYQMGWIQYEIKVMLLFRKRVINLVNDVSLHLMHPCAVSSTFCLLKFHLL